MSQGLCDRQQQEMAECYFIEDEQHRVSDERWAEYQNASSPILINPTDEQLDKIFEGVIQ